MNYYYSLFQISAEATGIYYWTGEQPSGLETKLQGAVYFATAAVPQELDWGRLQVSWTNYWNSPRMDPEHEISNSQEFSISLDLKFLSHGGRILGDRIFLGGLVYAIDLDNKAFKDKEQYIGLHYQIFLRQYENGSIVKLGHGVLADRNPDRKKQEWKLYYKVQVSVELAVLPGLGFVNIYAAGAWPLLPYDKSPIPGDKSPKFNPEFGILLNIPLLAYLSQARPRR